MAMNKIMRDVKPAELFMGKLKHGGDVLEEITDVCIRHNVRLGKIEAFGAVQKARLAFYNQESHEYHSFTLDQPLEITKLIGNVSIKDDKPFVHAHLTLADKKGNCYGGHLVPGTIVFACEFILQAFDGPLFERTYDEQTGLYLWNMTD
jgi:predicted DNA-binding protein with PD1-like motif